MFKTPKATARQRATLWAAVEAATIARFEDESDLLRVSYEKGDRSRSHNRDRGRWYKRDS